jgi:threonine dehydrogenase-like Zn-dependent dehydrogenase
MLTLHYPAFDQLEIKELPSPTPAPGEVIVRVAACGICGSELESFKNHSPRRPPPLVMGHEFCGVVDRLGEGVDPSWAGRRVVSNSVVACGHCGRCRRGDTHLCAARQIFGMHRPGAFAEEVAVPVEVLLSWPENLPAAAACLAEPLANGVHVAGLTAAYAAETVLVLGAGPIGLMCQQAMQVQRRSRVMVADLAAGRLVVATRLGAVKVVTVGQEDVVEVARAWTDGEGVDIAIDAAGSGATKRVSLAATRPGGVAVWIGLHGDKMELNSYDVTLPERHVIGSYAATQAELGVALDWMATGRVEVQSWVERVPLSYGVEAFQRMANPTEKDLKAVLRPNPALA